MERSVQYRNTALFLPERDFRFLFEVFGPSLGLWRAAEVAALREAGQGPRQELWQDLGFDLPILDLGCGDGLVTSLVLRQVAIGLDPDRAALDKAAGLGIYQQFVPMPMEMASLPENSLGTVVSNSVLEHIPAIDAVLMSAARVLRPGGRLIFTCPTETFSRWLALPGAGYAARRNRHFQHLNLWSVEDWKQHLLQAGLCIDCVRPYLRRGWVRGWDAVELLQMIYMGRTRVFGRFWRRLPSSWLDALARRAARVDLSSPEPGGGRLIVARKE